MPATGSIFFDLIAASTPIDFSYSASVLSGVASAGALLEIDGSGPLNTVAPSTRASPGSLANSCVNVALPGFPWNAALSSVCDRDEPPGRCSLVTRNEYIATHGHCEDESQPQRDSKTTSSAWRCATRSRRTPRPRELRKRGLDPATHGGGVEQHCVGGHAASEISHWNGGPRGRNTMLLLVTPP
jgi:hypothetical protein